MGDNELDSLRKKVKLLTEENQRLKKEMANNCGESKIDISPVGISVLSNIFANIFF